MSKKGILIVLSGPSGVGKTTICNTILARRSDIRYSVSATSRKKREGEQDNREYIFLGTLGKPAGEGRWELAVKNQILAGEDIEFIGPDFPYLEDNSFTILDGEGALQEKADHGKPYTLQSDLSLQEGFILRKKIPRQGQGTA